MCNKPPWGVGTIIIPTDRRRNWGTRRLTRPRSHGQEVMEPKFELRSVSLRRTCSLFSWNMIIGEKRVRWEALDNVGNTDYRCLSGRIMQGWGKCSFSQSYLAPECIGDLLILRGPWLVFRRAHFGKQADNPRGECTHSLFCLFLWAGREL